MEPNEREKEIASEAFSEAHRWDTQRPGERRWRVGYIAFARALAEYRAELRPEPTAGDVEAARKIIEELDGGKCWPTLEGLIIAALAAARRDEQDKVIKAFADGFKQAAADGITSISIEELAPHIAALLEVKGNE